MKIIQCRKARKNLYATAKLLNHCPRKVENPLVPMVNDFENVSAQRLLRLVAFRDTVRLKVRRFVPLDPTLACGGIVKGLWFSRIAGAPS